MLRLASSWTWSNIGNNDRTCSSTWVWPECLYLSVFESIDMTRFRPVRQKWDEQYLIPVIEQWLWSNSIVARWLDQSSSFLQTACKWLYNSLLIISTWLRVDDAAVIPKTCLTLKMSATALTIALLNALPLSVRSIVLHTPCLVNTWVYNAEVNASAETLSAGLVWHTYSNFQ